MKLGILTALLAGAFLLPAEGQAFHDVVFNRVGQPLAGASVAVCTSNPGSTTPPCSSSLALTTSSETGVTPCTISPATAGNTSGSGCSNPGITDAYGNYTVYIATPGMYWVQIYGTGVTTNVVPFVVLSPGIELDASQYSGSNFSAKVNACIAAVIALGGGICNAEALYGTQTISSEIGVGNGSSVSVALKLSPYLAATVTITNGTSCGIRMYDKSVLLGLAPAGSSQALIKANATTNVDSLLCTDTAGSGLYTFVEGLELWNSNATSGTFAHGMANIGHLFDDSVISRVFVRADGVRGWFIHDFCCGTTFYNIGANGFGTAASEPCVIGNNGEHSNGLLIGLSCVHPGDTKNAILVQDAGSSYTNLNFSATYVECNTTDAATALIQLNLGANGTAQMDGVQIAGPNCAGATAAYLIAIGATSKGVVLHNVRRGATLANTINDLVNSKTLTDAFVTEYSFGGSNYIYSLRIGATSAFTGKTGSGSNFVSDNGPTITSNFSVNDAAGTTRQLNFNTAGVNRWFVRANNTAEGGANAGSDFELSARDDSGAFLATTIGCTRSTSNCTFAGTVTAPTTNNTTSQTWNGQPVFVYVTSDFTTAANTNLQTITGLAWTMPGSLAINIPFDCYFQYSQATAAVSDSFGIQDVTTAPTQINANGTMQTNTTAFSSGPGVVALASTTATAVMTATPSAITTVWSAEMHGVIEQPSGTASAINIMVKTTTAADAVTVKRGSYCRVGPK